MEDPTVLPMPHKASISRWRLLIDVAYMLHCRVHMASEGVVRWAMVDSSTQGGKDYELIVVSFMRENDAGRLVRAANDLIALRYGGVARQGLRRVDSCLGVLLPSPPNPCLEEAFHSPRSPIHVGMRRPCLGDPGHCRRPSGALARGCLKHFFLRTVTAVAALARNDSVFEARRGNRNRRHARDRPAGGRADGDVGIWFAAASLAASGVGLRAH